MALQGTIDAFPVASVLQLLAGSNKTGRLIVEGDRSTAQLFVADGRVTGGSIRDVTGGDLTDVVLELLRYQAGSFLFEPGSVAPEALAPEDLDALVAAARERLDAWQAVEEVVPSTSHRLFLVPDLGEEVVQLDRSDWRVVVAAGANAKVSELAASLGCSELVACVTVAGLVERGILTVEGPGSGLVLADDPIVDDADATGATGAAADAAGAADRSGLVSEAAPAAASRAGTWHDGDDGDGGDGRPVAEAPTEIVDAELVSDQDPSQVHDPAYEVVLLADDADEAALAEEESIPPRFPIDDLLGGDEPEDPWVALENAGREDRLAAAQDFVDDADPVRDALGSPVGGGHPGKVAGEHGGAPSPAFADGYALGAFSPDAFAVDPAGSSAADPGGAASGAADPGGAGLSGDFGDRSAFGDPVTSFDPTASGASAGVAGTVFAGQGAFTEAGVALQEPAVAVDRSADDAADEVLRQMSKLSPKAAEAIAAALGTSAEADDPSAGNGTTGFDGF